MGGVMARVPAAVSVERIEGQILLIRGQRVMLDSALADLYEVEVRAVNQAVRRNLERFPADFMLKLSAEEAESLRSQSVILKTRRGQHRKYPPYAFTEQGIGMLSSVLQSKRAVMVNIEIMRAFVRLRQMLSANADLALKLDSLERRYDAQFKVVFDAIRELMTPAPSKKRPIGFT
jgi:hypothetical protein